jgi:hypothetical protein
MATTEELTEWFVQFRGGWKLGTPEEHSILVSYLTDGINNAPDTANQLRSLTNNRSRGSGSASHSRNDIARTIVIMSEDFGDLHQVMVDLLPYVLIRDPVESLDSFTWLLRDRHDGEFAD